MAFQHAIAPALRWLLAHSALLGPAGSEAAFGAYSFLYNALWLLPAYGVSLVVSNMWWACSTTSAVVMQTMQLTPCMVFRECGAPRLT